MAILPSFVYLSLILFFCGLTVYLSYIHPLSAFLSVSVFGAGAFIYVATIFVAAIDPFSPFRSPYSRVLGASYHSIYQSIAQPLKLRYLWETMALPQTASEKIRERMVKFILEHIPISEKWLFLDHENISDVSAAVLDKVLCLVMDEKSAFSRDVFSSVLLEFDDAGICPTNLAHRIWGYPLNCLTIKEAACIAHSLCMTSFLRQIGEDLPLKRAVVAVLYQSQKSWHHFMASLVQVQIDIGDRAEFPIARNEASIMRAISNTRSFTSEQWCFAIGSVDLIAQEQEAFAIARILERLLQKGVLSMVSQVSHIDVWLFVMVSLFDNEAKLPVKCREDDGTVNRYIKNAQRTWRYGKEMARDPSHIRKLVQLWRDQGLDPSFIRSCLVTFLYALISLRHLSEQSALIDQYIMIVLDEMDMDVWSRLLEPLAKEHPVFAQVTALCLLRRNYSWSACVVNGTRKLFREYDQRLCTTHTQPSKSMLTLVEPLSQNIPFSELNLRNEWLSLHFHNLTVSPCGPAIPTVWSSDCISVASDRLDLYDNRTIGPEAPVLHFFLSCPSTSIVYRALRHYLHIGNAAILSDPRVLTELPRIFHSMHSRDEMSDIWLLLIEEIIPGLEVVPRDSRRVFVEAFFGYGGPESQVAIGGDADGGTEADNPPTGTAKVDGLGWMEIVWERVLSDLARDVSIGRVSDFGLAASQCMQNAHLEGVDMPTTKQPSSDHKKEEGLGDISSPHPGDHPVKPPGERLEDSAGQVLGILADLLEAGGESLPTPFLDRVRESSLLQSEWLRRDVPSLNRIEIILGRPKEPGGPE